MPGEGIVIDVGHNGLTTDNDLIQKVNNLTDTQLTKILTDAKYDPNDKYGNPNTHMRLVDLVLRNFTDYALRSKLPKGGRRGHTRRRHGRRHRRRTRRARRRTAKKRGGEREKKYYREIAGTVYEYAPDGYTRREAIGTIGPTSTKEVEWINLDNDSQPSTPTGI